MYKTIFITFEGILSTEKINEDDSLASSYDLLEDLCMGEEPILGQLLLSDGIFVYFDNLDSPESISDVGEVCEYIKIGEVEEAIPIKKDVKHRIVINRKLLVASLIVCGICFYVI